MPVKFVLNIISILHLIDVFPFSPGGCFWNYWVSSRTSVSSWWEEAPLPSNSPYVCLPCFRYHYFVTFWRIWMIRFMDFSAWIYRVCLTWCLLCRSSTHSWWKSPRIKHHTQKAMKLFECKIQCSAVTTRSNLSKMLTNTPHSSHVIYVSHPGGDDVIRM